MCLTRRAKHLYKVIIARIVDARAVTGRGLFVFGAATDSLLERLRDSLAKNTLKL
jgi:hypothetical protein